MQEGTKMTKLRTLFLAAAMVCSSAHALVPGAGTDPQGAFLVDHLSTPGSFEQQWLFDLSTTSSVSSTAFSQWFGGPTDGLRNLTISLFQGSTLLSSAGPSTVTVIGGPLGAFTQIALNDTLAAGSYRLELTGDVQALGGNYVWTLNTNATSTAPVPEPEQWALFVAGLALVVGVSRRRKLMS
jgi:hypothetical protein